MGLLIKFDFGSGEEGKRFEGCVGGDFRLMEFFFVKGIGVEDFFQERCKFCVLKGAQAGGVEGFFVGDVVAGGGHFKTTLEVR
jgi:hypothetical protein